jgi:hypothetical protein
MQNSHMAANKKPAGQQSRNAAQPQRKSLQAGCYNGWQGYELMLDDG